MRENFCMLFGQISRDPEIHFELDVSGNKEYRAGILEVMTCRILSNKNMGEEGSAIPEDLNKSCRWDYITVFSRNSEIIFRDFTELERGDLVRVKGSLSTREVIRKHICPNCRYMNEYPGIILYVDPLCVQKVSESISEEDGILILQDAREHSNIIHLAGFVTVDPRFHECESDSSRDVLEFSIAGNRIRKILEDEDTRRTDYPWIKLYGELARKSVGQFRRGSEIYIRGALQKRTPGIIRKCLRCGEESEDKTDIMEVVPESVYLIRDEDLSNPVDNPASLD